MFDFKSQRLNPYFDLTYLVLRKFKATSLLISLSGFTPFLPLFHLRSHRAPGAYLQVCYLIILGSSLTVCVKNRSARLRLWGL